MKMNWKLLFVLVVCLCVIIDSVSSEEKKRRRRGRKIRRLKKMREVELTKLEEAVKEAEKLKEEIEHDMEMDEEVDEDDQVPLEDEDEGDGVGEEEGGEEEEEEETDENELDFPERRLPDPCNTHRCGTGKECVLTEDFEPKCQCIEVCPTEMDPRRKTCSNHNETWDGDCLVHQMRCWCHSGDDRCTDEKYKHLHIEYYGECTNVEDCREEEMAEFPERLREWLFNVMREMVERRALSEHYAQLEKESEHIDSDNTEKWLNAVIWKWCDLDGHPRDKKVSRHELFPIRAPLLSLEHCIAPFLDGCDKDDDHFVTLREWGDCLKIPDEILEDKCEEVTGDD